MAAPKKNNVPFFVSYGGEDYFLDQDIEKARQWKDREIIFVDGEGMPDQELVTLCEEHGEEPRVVIVDTANKIKGDKALKLYIEERSPTDLSTILFAIVRSEKLPEVWSKAAAKGRLMKHEKLKTFDSNNEVVKFIDAEFRRVGLRTDVGISQTVYDVVGPGLHKIVNEVRKLALLVPEGDKVTKKHLSLVLSPSPSAEPYEVADAVVEKNPRKAMNTLSIVYKTMGEEANVPITAALLKAVEKVAVARRILDRGGNEEDVAARLSMNPWRCKTQFIPNVRKHDLGSLVRHMGRLCKLDVDVKGPARSKRTLVELAVLSIAAG
jgi:DNA polymerase III delta subunit